MVTQRRSPELYPVKGGGVFSRAIDPDRLSRWCSADAVCGAAERREHAFKKIACGPSTIRGGHKQSSKRHLTGAKLELNASSAQESNHGAPVPHHRRLEQ